MARFYFIEMNTRLQVEHPVTEMVTGIDIVEEQIRVAAGETLGYGQDDIRFAGHAIECRINAEDPRNFTPAPGTITDYHPPGGLGVRVDSGAYAGYCVPPYYDSLIAKLVVHGVTREECLMRLKRSLDEYVIGGIQTTIPLHRALTNDDDFVTGDYNIHWLEEFIGTIDGMLRLTPEIVLHAYMRGVFPMAESRHDPTLYWIDPEMRGVIPLDAFHVPRRLARTVRHWADPVYIDRDFRAVIEACAEPGSGRRNTWINDEIVTLYAELHEMGFAHSVECWNGARLIGGLYGISIQGAFFGESMFSQERDASKVALVHLVARLRSGGLPASGRTVRDRAPQTFRCR